MTSSQTLRTGPESMPRPKSFCESKCEHWDGKCSFIKTDHYPCAFRIAQVIKRENDTIDAFRIGRIWYNPDWTEKPAPPLPDPNRGGCCG